jgi:hypothetical protein
VNHYLPAFMIIAALTSASSFAEQCEADKTLRQAFAGDDISTLKINALAGYLEITASKSEDIQFEGHACSDKSEWVERMTLDVERQDDTLTLTVMIPYNDSDFDARHAYMDVDLSLPPHIALEVKDSSGDIIIDGTSTTRVDDSSGNIRVSHNKSSLTISDSSGDITVRDLKGDVEVSDSSGDIDIREIAGSVNIPRDSSGKIEIQETSGKVSIGSDGSGDIEISNIADDVDIDSDGSGNIKIHDVKGQVTIGSDGSGGIDVTKISGDLLVNAKGSGNVKTRDIEGEISLPR